MTDVPQTAGFVAVASADVAGDNRGVELPKTFSKRGDAMTQKMTGHDKQLADEWGQEKKLDEFIENCRRRGDGAAKAPPDDRPDEPIPDLLYILWDISQSLRRIADRVDPSPPDKVGTDYIAEKLGCTKQWVAQMVSLGKIPANCIVAGTGNGKLWKFYRGRIDAWIRKR